MTAAGEVATEHDLDRRVEAIEALVEDRPRDAVAAATALLAELAEASPTATTAGGWESRLMRSVGLARRALGDPPGAVEALRDAVARAANAGRLDLEVDARLSLAPALAYTGDLPAAFAELDHVEAIATQTLGAATGGVAEGLAQRWSGLAEHQRAGLLQRMGRVEEALACYDRAEPALRADGPSAHLAHLLTNRGLLFVYLGRLAEALADLAAAPATYDAVGNRVMAAAAIHNLGFLHTRRGDIPQALACFDQAEEAFTAVGYPLAQPRVDRCEALLGAGLVDDAVATARAAAEQLESLGNLVDGAEAWLLQAQAARLAGRAEEAATSAQRAADLFAAQGRAGWQAHAELESRLAELLATPRAGGEAADPAGEVAGLAEVDDLARRLDDSGQASAALAARLLAVRLAASHGDPAGAADRLQRIEATTTGRAAAPVSDRVELWSARAVVRLAAGDRAGAVRAARAGMGVVGASQALLGAADSRANLSRHAAELARLGLREAVASGRPRRVLAWMERFRANALRFRPVRPPEDPESARLLGELRTVVAELRDLERAAAGDGPRDEEAERALRLRQQRLESAVRRAAHRQAGDGRGGAADRALPSDLDARLDGNELLALSSLDGELLGVHVVGGRANLVRLGSWAAHRRDVVRLRQALDRLAVAAGSTDPRRRGGLVPALAAVDQLRARLGSALLGAVRPGNQPLLVIPHGELHLLPWAALPTCWGRPFSVAPSLDAWLTAPTPPTVAGKAGRTLLVAGPRLTHAAGEVAALQGLHPQPLTLVGAAAQAGAVTAAFAAVDVAHLACHGSFRADNPLLSSLEMADGPLWAHELERLAAAPRLVVLSACEAAGSATRPGDELLGFSATLLAAGTGALVASTGLVPDVDGTLAFMASFHRSVAGGRGPADALADARSGIAADAGNPASVGAFAAASSFTCYGRG